MAPEKKKSNSSKAKRTAQDKAAKEFGMSKGTTSGKLKAVRKVQKGVDKTQNRIPSGRPVVSTIKNNKVGVIDETGKFYPTKGSNRKAVKGLTPKRTPGVSKKDKNYQRGINKDNLILRGRSGRGGGGGAGLFGTKIR